jgi:hypothetical protein
VQALLELGLPLVTGGGCGDGFGILGAQLQTGQIMSIENNENTIGNSPFWSCSRCPLRFKQIKID